MGKSGSNGLAELCRRLLDEATIPVVAVKGSERVICYANPAYCRLAGRSAEELVDTISLPEEWGKEACASLMTQMMSKGGGDGKGRHAQIPGSPDEPCTMWAIPGPNGGPAAIALQIDWPATAPALHQRLTEMSQKLMIRAVSLHEAVETEQDTNRDLRGEIQKQKGMTEALEEALQVVQEARKSAEGASVAKSVFLADMTHELRTPLTALIGFCEMMQEDAKSSENNALLLDAERILEISNHLVKLISDILDLSKAEAGKTPVHLSTFSVDHLIRSVAEQSRPLVAKKGNVLKTRIAGNLGPMHSDEMKMRQVLLNLISNAAKFTDHGTIQLEAEPDPVDCDRITLRVRDTGIGIAAEEIEKLFGLFYQIQTRPGARPEVGTGLGLAISKKFAELLGGDIRVESTPGKGSVFSVSLPSHAPARP